MPAATVPPAPSLASAVRLTAEQVVPESVEQDVAQGADRAAAVLGVEWGTVAAVVGAFLAVATLTWGLFLLARLVLFRRDGIRAQVTRLTLPVSLFTGLLGARIALTVMAEEQAWFRPASFVLLVAVAAAAAWAAWRIVGAVEGAVLARYRHPGVNDRRERKIRTQTILIRRVLNAVIVVVALAAVLLAIPEVRSLGAGLLASAGLISVIAGLAVQSTLTNVFAGFQLAFTDAIRVGDVVDMEGVFGTVEEITLSNVVLKLWDGRRMVYPSSHFTTQPFENWTRVGAEVSGVVELDVDWRVPMDALRARLTQLLESTDLWDGREHALQVTDATGGVVRIRAVVSARNSGDLWDLRCLVREDLVAFLRHEHPEGIVVQRMVVRHPAHDDAAPASEGSDAGARGGDRTGEPGPDGSGVAAREPRPRTAPLPRVDGADPRPDTLTTPLTRVGDHSGLYTGSMTAVQRNRELAGPGEEAFAERRAQQAKQAAEAAAADEAGRRSGAGSHADGPLDDAVTRRRQDDED